ncbi:FAD-binding oxidoreductase [Pedobacter aquatilis]|uniref:NAD(P)/FAD-dependent oxidoreductase n=1 Tax=Pedobacter aquatilis TaxID=351343 RepID=UPI0025B5944F|nr:FAD-binding oxidoreductase [Pedobacter aquatilis]MDN3586652.1 FAD-binding oxidoreductase [Pedobacter aquatilis]
MNNQLSYWEKTAFFDFDIIIVGSGIVGLNAAIHLITTIPKLKIAILESGFLPSGASTKNAGFACFGSISELMEQEKICGINALADLIEKRWKGMLKLRKILGDDKIDYKQLGGYELFKPDDKILSTDCVVKIEHYNKLIHSIIGPDAFKVNNSKLKIFGFEGIESIIENRYEAQIDTGKMMFALIQLAQQLGVSIFNSCEVEEISTDENKPIVKTRQGNFKGKKVIVTINAFVNKLIPGLDVKPGRGQVLVTKPIKKLKVAGTFHYDKGYYYFRNINDRILLGGGRNLDFRTEETTELGLTTKIQDALYNLLNEVILPGTDFEIDYKWSGIMAFGKTLSPIITEAKPNVFCAVRCNGMGVAMGSQTGADVAELVLRDFF